MHCLRREEQGEAERQAALADELGGDVLDDNMLLAEEEQPPDDMFLSSQERMWACQLREVVQREGNGIDPLTDFEYVEHAIVAQGNVEEAVERIRGLQTFREVYHPQETVDSGVYYFQESLRLQPGLLIHMDIVKETGTGIIAWNYAMYDPSRLLSTEQNWKAGILGQYYVWKMLQPTFRSIRGGSYQLIEGGDVGWHNFNMVSEQRWGEELANHCPHKVKQILVYHCGVIMNVVWSLVKPFLREEMTNGVCLGCTYDSENPDATLMDMFCQPNLEAAEEKMVENARRFLTIRYQNRNWFRL